ncbi:cell division cycle protein 20 homolog isoform X2 [Antennarius striatus]
MAGWQRKASSSSTLTFNGLSPGHTATLSQGTAKTRSETKGKKMKPRPCRMDGDRFIPTRNNKQMEVASYLLTKKKEPVDTKSPSQSVQKRKVMSLLLNGYDINDEKILSIGGNSLQGFQNNKSKVHCSEKTAAAPTKRTRRIPSAPDRILDAPAVHNDFYLNVLEWSSQDMLTVGLDNTVYLWNATEGVTRLMNLERGEGYVCSLSWCKEGNYIAVGTSDSEVQLWDVERQKRLRILSGYRGRVGCLSWNDHVLSCGLKSGEIRHHDVRVADHHICTLTGHSQEVCGLQWSPDGRYLASGGGDSMVKVWPRVQQGSISNAQQSIHSWNLHQGSVKALAWCPWKPNILASGGGTSDCHIRLWNTSSGICIKSLDTQSQILSLVFAPNYNELVSAHGRSDNNVVIWQYPSLTKVKELFGHKDRVLGMTLNPDRSTIATLGADETICLWKSFKMKPVKKTTMTSSTLSLMRASMR